MLKNMTSTLLPWESMPTTKTVIGHSHCLTALFTKCCDHGHSTAWNYLLDSECVNNDTVKGNINMKHLKHAALAALILIAPTAALAQESNYTPGTVWQSARIEIEPGQYENYMDYLDTKWKAQQELGKREGYIVSYHVLAVDSKRAGEPDLLLVTEFKDHMTTAQIESFRKKIEAMMTADSRKMDMASGERRSMRKLAGLTEYQEMKLK